MKNFKAIVVPVLLVALAISVTTVGGQGNPFVEGFNILDPASKAALTSLAGPFGMDGFLDSLKQIQDCIQEEMSSFDLCNFDTSYDPFYYLAKCANNTIVWQILEPILQNIEQVKFKTGVPPTVSKDRCFLSPDYPSLTSMPTSPSIPGFGK